jgi:lipoyl(octanoyl) transferase
MRWLFFVTRPADGAYNMALDEALMRRAARAGEAVFRVYSWSVPTLSLGRNQRARDCYDERAGQAMGVRFVRRPTGGRALLHHREVTYSATLPLADADEARASYDFINTVLLGGLSRLGVNARRATDTKALPPGLRPCFDVPAEHEIALNGRKLVGSAQWRHAGALLQHGSILVRDDQSIITRLLREPADGSTSAATLADALGRDPSVSEVAEPILESLEEATQCSVGSFVVDSDIEADAARLRGAYEDAAWTWRR